tara:strand:+ start:48786 stop:49046 length:261 start_codon:yes stop_codon:yes gene_type:complete
MITQFTTPAIITLNNALVEVFGNTLGFMLTYIVSVITIGTVLFFVMGSFRGFDWMKAISENGVKFSIYIGVPTVIISWVLISVAGI